MTALLTQDMLASRRERDVPVGVRRVAQYSPAAGTLAAEGRRTNATDAIEDMIDLALDMTFPASDPPAWSFREAAAPSALPDPPASIARVDNSAFDILFVDLLARYRPWRGLSRYSEVCRMLPAQDGLSCMALAGWVTDRTVFGFEWGSAFWLPTCQFVPNSGQPNGQPRWEPRTWPRSVCRELAPVFDGWRIARWLVEPNAWLQDRTPIMCVDQHLHEVLEAARADRFVAAG
jgi:hypothetical protein